MLCGPGQRLPAQHAALQLPVQPRAPRPLQHPRAAVHAVQAAEPAALQLPRYEPGAAAHVQHPRPGGRCGEGEGERGGGQVRRPVLQRGHILRDGAVSGAGGGAPGELAAGGGGPVPVLVPVPVPLPVPGGPGGSRPRTCS